MYTECAGARLGMVAVTIAVLACPALAAGAGTNVYSLGRIGFITVGLLGFWGEWHTYPHTEWFASVSVQDQVLAACTNAFRQTRLLVRYPNKTGSFSPATLPMGYHDDSFAYSTIAPPGWHFLGQMAEARETNKWRTQPIGGEVRPEVQSCLSDTNQPNCVPLGQVQIVPHAPRPGLRGSLSGSDFQLIVSNAAPGLWTLEATSNLNHWTPLLSTNTSTPDWSVMDEASAAARFYRVVK